MNFDDGILYRELDGIEIKLLMYLLKKVLDYQTETLDAETFLVPLEEYPELQGTYNLYILFINL